MVAMEFHVGDTEIIVKEEDDSEFEIETNTPTVDTIYTIESGNMKLFRNPIVYTTKLDDMKIFKANIKEMSVNTIVNSIIEESKPKINRKRKWKPYLTDDPHMAYVNLSCHLYEYNSKIARITKKKNHLLSLCNKSVRVVLEDIKYTLLRPKSTVEQGNKINKTNSNFRNMLDRLSNRLYNKIVFDTQSKTADIYSLDKRYIIREHAGFPIAYYDDEIYNMYKDKKNISKVYICCWYWRETYINSLTSHSLATLQFMRKPHYCGPKLCICCCSTKKKELKALPTIATASTSSKKTIEIPRIWFHKLAETYAVLPRETILKYSIIPKCLSVVPNISQIKTEKKEDHSFLHSTIIDFGEEFYEIGGDGKIKLYSKSPLNENYMPSYTRAINKKIVGNICCWYKREEFTVRLLALGALPDSVNFIRYSHPCSSTVCNCCCKPKINNRVDLTLFLKVARHTADMDSKKINFEIDFFKAAAPSVAHVPDKEKINRNIREVPVKRFFSFYFSLAAIEAISKKKKGNSQFEYDVNSIITEIDLFSKKDIVENRILRIIIDMTTRNSKLFVEGVNLNTITVKELELLNLFLNTLERLLPRNTKSGQQEKPQQWFPRKITQKPPQKNSAPYIHPKRAATIPKQQNVVDIAGPKPNINQHPLTLNARVSQALELRTKRFLLPLTAHIARHEMLNQSLDPLS